MHCSICHQTAPELTPIEAESIEKHQLCERCLLDLLTNDFADSDDDDNESGDLPNDSDDSKSFFDDNSVLDVSGVKVEDKPIENKNTDGSKAGCSLCDKKFQHRKSLAQHMRTFHPEEKLNRCNICRLFFKGEVNFSEHIQSEHGGSNYSCMICLEGYNKGKKAEHKRKCPGRLIFRCGLCSQFYVSKEGLEKHCASHEIKAECNVKNEEMRSPVRIYNCVLCDDDRGYEENPYWNHIHEAHDGHHLLCRDCGKTFRTRKHMNVHTGGQCKEGSKAVNKAAEVSQLPQLQCEHCLKFFKNRNQLQSHISKIHVAKPCVCDLCGLGVANRSQLRYHKLTIHNEAKEQCPHCPKVFHLPVQLQQHLITHGTARTFVCDECGRSFKRKLDLKVHQKSHQTNPELAKRRRMPGSSGQFACDLCDRKFLHKYVLENHKKTHDPNRVLEMKYACKECDKKFSTPTGLIVHMKSKFVHEHMTCPVCGALLKGKVRYEAHMKLHSEQP